MKEHTIQNVPKPVRFVMTQGWSSKYGGLEAIAWIIQAKKQLAKHPIDMLIFENAGEGKVKISMEGYDLNSGEYIKPTKLAVMESMPIDKFWLKLDDQGEYLSGTFLFPEEY